VKEFRCGDLVPPEIVAKVIAGTSER